ncbi:MAG: translation initiation factor [Sulfurimonadaceae bacterium]|jgi:translation initiation factor 1|nr:translation initiation factor [Sulfurimonadaceae bacterium]
MPRGKKLDLFIGAEIEEGCSLVVPRQSTIHEDILAPNKHDLFFKKEKRNGKTITLVGEFYLDDNLAQTMLKDFKKKLGCGGAYKDGWMEFQGEIRPRLRELLVDLEFRFKLKH